MQLPRASLEITAGLQAAPGQRNDGMSVAYISPHDTEHAISAGQILELLKMIVLGNSADHRRGIRR
jgi:hypothetical protein